MGREGEVKAQDEREEDANPMHEESHVSNRHMTWWQNAWWVRVNNGPHLRTARDRRLAVYPENDPKLIDSVLDVVDSTLMKAVTPVKNWEQCDSCHDQMECPSLFMCSRSSCGSPLCHR